VMQRHMLERSPTRSVTLLMDDIPVEGRRSGALDCEALPYARTVRLEAARAAVGRLRECGHSVWSHLWSQMTLGPAGSSYVRGVPKSGLSKGDGVTADTRGRPQTKIGQLVMRRSRVRIPKAAPAKARSHSP
jgi:hypothetical protein